MEYYFSSIVHIIWVVIFIMILFRAMKFTKNRPGRSVMKPVSPESGGTGSAGPQRFEGLPRQKAKLPGKRPTMSDDGYRVPKEQDITCTGRDGHSHPGADGPRYIVHEKAEEGYVILNGVKRRLKDCRNL